MRKLNLTIRIIFGFILLVFGIIEVFKLSTMHFSGHAQVLMDALVGAEYFFPIIGGIEIISGVSLIMNRFVPLALLLMMPISINFLLFHLFLDATSIPPAIVIFVLNGYLLFAHAKYYKSLLNKQPLQSPLEKHDNYE